MAFLTFYMPEKRTELLIIGEKNECKFRPVSPN